MRLKMTFGSVSVFADLKDTPTAKKIEESLPFQSSAMTWGDEVYFTVPVRAPLEPDARQVVDPGTVCFWTHGNALALPFGPTPISQGNECRLADRCNILGKLDGDPGVLKQVRSRDAVRVEKA